MVDKPPPTSNGENIPKVVFHYIKSQLFRVVHADGAVGSIAPTQNIHMAIVSERAAIPQRLAFRVNQEGSLGEQIASEMVAREGFVREVEVDIVMNLRAAEAILDWLSKRVHELKEAQAASPPKSTN